MPFQLVSYPPAPADSMPTSLGRNGLIRTSAVRVYDCEKYISIEPITSRGLVGRCSVDLPADGFVLTQMANALLDIARRLPPKP